MKSEEEIVIYNIQKYSHSLDLDCLINVASNLSFAKFEVVACRLLQSDNVGLISNFCLAIRDSIVIGNKYDELKEYCLEYPTSSIVTAIENLLFSHSRQNINDAIYTLGKTRSDRSISVLTKAFYRLKDTDPLILPRLFCELQWLGVENYWELINSMISSEIYFTRWSILELLPEDIAGDSEENIRQSYLYLDKLKQDPCKYIRVEADYRYRLINFNQKAKNLPKQERNKQRKQLQKEEKHILTFSHLSILFNNYLYSESLNKYAIADLETFIKYLLFFRNSYQIGQ